MLHMNNTKKLEFNKKILVNFDWWEITWNTWLLLIEEFFNKLQVKKLLEKYLPDLRKGDFKHTKSEIIYQELYRIISWITSNNNYIYQKNDPIFNQIYNNKIASSAICTRLEKTFDFSDIDWFR